MTRCSMVRMVASAVLAVSTAGLAAALTFAAPAAAKTSGVTCKHISGSGTLASLTNCSGASHTGGSGTLPLSNPSTIAWANGKTTTVSPFSQTLASPDESEKYSCPAGTTEYNLSGTVSADTTGVIPVGSTLSAEICFNSANMVANEKLTKFRI